MHDQTHASVPAKSLRLVADATRRDAIEPRGLPLRDIFGDVGIAAALLIWVLLLLGTGR